MFLLRLRTMDSQTIWAICLLVAAASLSSPCRSQDSGMAQTGDGSSNYQYASVPHHGAWEFGYKRGNPYHFQERHEVGRGPHFKTKVRWGDHYGGYGEQHYDYNHVDKGYGGHQGGGYR